MKAIIFDIDGTLTDMWPIERLVIMQILGQDYTNKIDQLKDRGISENYKIFSKLSKTKAWKKVFIISYNKSFSYLLKRGGLPTPESYPLVEWIQRNSSKYNFVYATGGQRLETLYVLERLGIKKYFDLESSVDKTSCRFSKRTGIPFKKIKLKYSDCILVTDSKTDCEGAAKVGVRFIQIKPKQKVFNQFVPGEGLEPT